MNLTCTNCESAFEASRFRGYCDECIEEYRKQRDRVHERQHPSPGVTAVGKFASNAPTSATDPITDRQVCFLCGGELFSGYGLAGGYGLGAYMCCEECYAVQDFCEDSE